MTSFDFALKDLYRKRHSNYPFLLIIILIVAFTEFLIYFTSSFGINIFIQTSFVNKYFFSGGINLIFKQFSALIQILLVILTVVIVITVTTSLVISKKKDIAIMKSLGTLPQKLYSFYLYEVYLLYFIGFLFGWIFGLISFGLFALIMHFLNFSIFFQFDLFFTPIIFVACIIGIFIITGYTIRKIGRQEIIKTFSKDIPYDYDASKPIKFIPKWLTLIGINIKIAVVNTLRRKGEFKRYIIVFSIIGLIIFTLGLGVIVINISSKEWIVKSQNENIVIIGHKDVVYNYSLMYKMFSDSSILVDDTHINFVKSDYLFNLTDLNDLNYIEEIEKIDNRLINFYSVEENPGLYISEDGTYTVIGQNRDALIPIIGVNPDNVIQNFETEGSFFTKEDAYDNITIGDSLANNLFDNALYQSLELINIGRTFHISGIVFDSFYSGWAAYIDLNIIQQELDLTTEINLLMLKLKNGAYNEITPQLTNITNKLGQNFTHLNLNNIFKANLEFLSIISLYPLFLIIILAIISILSLYNYQKNGIMEKARDFLIMRAIGSKTRSLKKILFLESFFVLIPSLFLSLAIGMIVNSLFLLDRSFLPPLYVPFVLFLILFIIFLAFNFLSLFPIMKKINNFSIKDFNIY